LNESGAVGWSKLQFATRKRNKGIKKVLPRERNRTRNSRV